MESVEFQVAQNSVGVIKAIITVNVLGAYFAEIRSDCSEMTTRYIQLRGDDLRVTHRRRAGCPGSEYHSEPQKLMLGITYCVLTLNQVCEVSEPAVKIPLTLPPFDILILVAPYICVNQFIIHFNTDCYEDVYIKISTESLQILCLVLYAVRYPAPHRSERATGSSYSIVLYCSGGTCGGGTNQTKYYSQATDLLRGQEEENGRDLI
ncbi:hypothetical protein NQ318_017547 [Aromia moschata]|uniref:Uncharacterized protein n=1 Tax=Aromia moschata TaxID=1265417 RepID=A0AAV8Z313_9CUCU|nr:hypothetical protein NQ318_017547 [Aromia moschata]